MKSLRNEYLRIGQIVRAHGVHGDIKLLPLTDDPARFKMLTDAYIEQRGTFLPAKVGNVRLQPPDACILHVEGCETVETAEQLKNAYLCVDRAHAVKLPADTYFVADLIGCQTFDTEGNAFGRISDVLETGANDVYEIEAGKLMVPALKRVLHEVDLEQLRIVFNAAVLREVGLFAD
ncbi:MAG: ribosome maturation factor RimM [Clostridia bacterium]